jgi:hypothetical protein
MLSKSFTPLLIHGAVNTGRVCIPSHTPSAGRDLRGWSSLPTPDGSSAPGSSSSSSADGPVPVVGGSSPFFATLVDGQVMLIDQAQGEGVRTGEGGVVNSQGFKERQTDDDDGEGEEVRTKRNETK